LRLSQSIFHEGNLSVVMRGHSRPKDGVASLAYDPRISLKRAPCPPKRDGRDNGVPANNVGGVPRPGHDEKRMQFVGTMIEFGGSINR
jgi:hypothetical protein